MRQLLPRREMLSDATGVIKMNLYRCNRCKNIYERDSDAYWIKSYCEKTGKNARLYRISLNRH